MEFIKGEILDYWLNNEGSVSNPAVERDAFNAVIRGRLIQHCSYLKKKSVQRLQLEVDIKKMENVHSAQSDHFILLELNKLKVEYNSILQKKVEYTLFRTKHKYYEKGERTGRFLAQRAKQQYTQSIIPGIRNDRGELKTDDMDINAIFATFYQSLYKSDNPNTKDISSFLSNVNCPTLSREEQGQIGADITLEEVKKAMQDLQGGKSPGGGWPPS